MGGSSSKTVVNQLSEQISNIAMSTVQECEVTAQQDQSIDVVNTGFKFWGTYKLKQESEIDSTCFSDIKKQIDLQNKVIQAIAQATTSQNVGILGAFGSSDSAAETNLTNIVRNNVTMSNIQKSYEAIKQNQSAKFTNTGVIGFESVELTQGSKLFAAATLQEIDRAGIFNAIETHVNQESMSKVENPMDFIANIFSAITSNMIFFIIIIAVAVIGFGALAGRRSPRKQVTVRNK